MARTATRPRRGSAKAPAGAAGPGAGSPPPRLTRGGHIARAGLVAGMVVGSLILWAGMPVFWLWLASQLQQSQQPRMGPYLLVIAGIVLSAFAIGKGLAVLGRAYGRLTGSTQVRVRMPWHRSMRGEEDSRPTHSVLDVIMVATVGTAVGAFLVWFFLFAGSSLPTT
jgi:hypothetical protein